MVPTQVAFWAFLLVGVPVFWLLPRRFRHGFLGLASAGLLASVAPWSAVALTVWLLVFHRLAPLVEPGRPRRRRFLLGGVLAIAGFLAYYKFLPPVVEGLFGEGMEKRLLVPLGISYYTFKLVHYLVEVALGNVKERSLQQLLCYLFLVPIFTAGPIQRYDHFLAAQEERWSLDSTVEGLWRMVHGLIKKFLLADLLAIKLFQGRTTPETLPAMLEELSPWMVWSYAAAMYVWIYLDFSAYTDLAIGASRLFGIRIMENFHFPVIASDIRDYWRRWHMSLSGWCQSYVYMPLLGLYRRPMLSLYATFFVMGMWHSGTWTRLAWGLYHATGVAVFTLWAQWKRKHRVKRLPRPLARPLGIAATQAFVAGSMAFLILPETDFHGALRILCKLLFLDLA